MTELLIASDPDPASSLAYLVRVPLGDGLVLRTSGTWPRTKAVCCHPVPLDVWSDVEDVLERDRLAATGDVLEPSPAGAPLRAR